MGEEGGRGERIVSGIKRTPVTRQLPYFSVG